MSFKLQPKATFKHPVEFFDHDGESLGVFHFNLRAKTKKEMRAFWEWARKSPEDGGPASDGEAVLALVESVDEHPGDLTAQEIDDFFDPLLNAASQFFAAYNNALVEFKRKN